MMRKSIPVLLVVLTLLCAFPLHGTRAWADEPGGSLTVPTGCYRPEAGAIVETTGATDDDSSGDPDAYGDGTLSKRTSESLLGGTATFCGEHDTGWATLLLRLLEFFPIVR